MPGFGSPLIVLGMGEEPTRDGPAIEARQPDEFRGEEKAASMAAAYLYVMKFPNGNFQYMAGLDRAVQITNLPDVFTGAGNPQTFSPTQVRHGIIAAQSRYEPRHVNLHVPSNDPEIRKFFVTSAPVRIEAWILRINGDALRTDEPTDFERGGYLMESGILGQFAFSGPTILAELTPEVYFQSGGIPRIYSQRPCNHALYGPGCGLNRDDFAYETTILSLNPAQREVVITGQKPGITEADYFSLGHFRHAVLGMEFDIGWSEFLGGDTKLKLLNWHPEFETGQTVTAYAGCTKIVRICRDRFSNVANFLGFPHVPKKNPAVNGT